MRNNKDDLHNLSSDDLLSRLPDEILVSILSSLPLKDATVTSLLSRRWRYLRCQTDSLVFEDRKRWSSILDSIGTVSDLCFLNEERNKYIDWVNNIIHQHKSPTIDKFKICFGLNENAKGAISEWIEFAISKNVRALELILLRKDRSSGNYCFPNEIFDRKCGSLLKQHSVNVPVMEIKFLKSLILEYVDVNDEGLKKILSNCPVLEHLSIFFSYKLVKAEIHGKGLALKKLDIISCLGLESIEICDLNIVSFSCCRNLPISLRLDNLQKLEKICLKVYHSLEKINDMFSRLSCIPYLQVLDLHLNLLKGFIELLPFPKLQKLKQLMIRVIKRDDNCLLLLTSLVEACPNLQRFKVADITCFNAGKTNREVRQMAKKPHQCLEVVEIDNYYCRTSDLELVMYFFQNCVALKKLVIIPTVKDENGARYHAQHHLKPRTPVFCWCQVGNTIKLPFSSISASQLRDCLDGFSFKLMYGSLLINLPI